MTQGIIMAAGMGRRMRGFTEGLPKSLMVADGKALIERNIDLMLEAGCSRVTVVVGYRKELFAYLPDKYQGRVQLIENSRFETSNTVSSLYEARVFFDQDTFISAADIFLDTNIYSEFPHEGSYYVLLPVQSYEKPDWIAKLDEESRILEVETRGTYGHGYTGISHWDVDALKVIREKLEAIDWDDGAQRKQYWDELVLDELDALDVHAQILPRAELLWEFDDQGDVAVFEAAGHTFGI